MLKITAYLVLSLISFNIIAQKLHALEPISGHYANLAKFSPKANASRSEMDQIGYQGRRSGVQYIGMLPTYLTQKNVDQLKSSLQFPANSSDQTRAELDFLLEWEKKRTDKDKKRALEIAPIGYWPPERKDNPANGYNTEHLFWVYSQVTGNDLPIKSKPATLKLMAGITRDMRVIEFTIKYHLLRPRPYHLDQRLNPMARISSPSYASGHTLWAYIQAFTWSELMPGRRKDFLAVAYEVGESREIMGIHFPGDEEAARVLAHRMLELMWDNPEFQQDLANAKSEW